MSGEAEDGRELEMKVEWMDIDSPPGTKVVFDPVAAHSYDKGANSGLTVGKTYTVQCTEVYSFHTDVLLEEVEGRFNCTMFHKPIKAMTTPPKSARPERRIGGERREAETHTPEDIRQYNWMKLRGPDRRAPDAPAQGEGGTARKKLTRKWHATDWGTLDPCEQQYNQCEQALDTIDALERSLTVARKDLETQVLVSQCLGRQVNDKDKDRIYFRDKLTAATKEIERLREALREAMTWIPMASPPSKERDRTIAKCRAALASSAGNGGEWKK